MLLLPCFAAASQSSHALQHHVLSACMMHAPSHTVYGGAGGVSFSYGGAGGMHNNTHIISNITIRDSKGGDATQGAGGLAIQSLGKTSALNVSIQDSTFASNQALLRYPEQSPLTGVAGAVRITAKSTEFDTSNIAQFTNSHFHSNSLGGTCTSGLCIAGALAVSVQTIVEGCTFDGNTCPRGSGGLYADRMLELRHSTLTNNTATQAFFGTANVAAFTAVNTSMHFNGPLSGIVFSNLSAHERFMLTCSAGEEINNSTPGQYLCRRCPSKNTLTVSFSI